MIHLNEYLTKIHRKYPLTWIDLRYFGDGSGNVKIQHGYIYAKTGVKDIEIFQGNFWNNKSKNETEYRAVKALKKWSHCNCAKITQRIKADERRIRKCAMKHINDNEGGG